MCDTRGEQRQPSRPVTICSTKCVLALGDSMVAQMWAVSGGMRVYAHHHNCCLHVRFGSCALTPSSTLHSTLSRTPMVTSACISVKRCDLINADHLAVRERTPYEADGYHSPTISILAILSSLARVVESSYNDNHPIQLLPTHSLTHSMVSSFVTSRSFWALSSDRALPRHSTRVR